MGDSVISLDHQALTLYDQIMAKLPHMSRPMAIGFRKKMEGIGNNAPIIQKTSMLTVRDVSSSTKALFISLLNAWIT